MIVTGILFSKKAPVDDGPVITISVLTGCDARQVAAILAEI